MTNLAQATAADNAATITEDETTMFYVVSQRKLAVLYICTLGLYSLYWFYKNWDCYRDKLGYDSERSNIWPVMRAIFAIFFTHSLFREIKAYGEDKEKVANWSNDTHASLLVLTLIVQNVVSRMGSNEMGRPLVDYLFVASLPLVLLVMMKAQAIINIACGDPGATRNSNFTGANYAWIAVGTIWSLLVYVGMFLVG